MIKISEIVQDTHYLQMGGWTLKEIANCLHKEKKEIIKIMKSKEYKYLLYLFKKGEKDDI